MPGGKKYIKIRPDEKELYRIFKELEMYGRSTFSYKDGQKQRGIAQSIGIRGKSLYDRDLFIPPASTRQHRINIVALPIGVEITEKKEKGIHYFYFKKKPIF